MRRPRPPHLPQVALLGLALAAGGCDCGAGAQADAGPGPSPGCVVPSTSTWQRVNGGVAGPAADPGGCQQPISASALPGAQVQALGVHAVGEVLRFTVPAGTGGLSIVSQASSGVVDSIDVGGGGRTVAVPNTVIPTLLRMPDGTVLYNDDATPPTDGTTALVWFAGSSPGTGSLTLPNTTRGLAAAAQGYPAGTWSMVVNDYAAECTRLAGCDGGSTAGRYDVTVLTRPLAYATGTLDLSFYLVTPTLTATQAMTDAHVQRFLTTLATFYARAGLCLGTITFYDVPAWARARYATGVDASKRGPCDPMKQLFTLSRPSTGLHFFLVDAITQGAEASDAGEVVGVDGTIPGPATVAGTVQSGAVVNFSDYAAGGGCSGAPNFGRDGGVACGADVTAYIAAHEGGHFLGLYHTTESFGGLSDPLTDTATCACDTSCGVSATANACCLNPTTNAFRGVCASGQPTLLFSTNCSRGTATCGGASSLMFWVLDTASVGNLSAQQAEVLRSNPAVH